VATGLGYPPEFAPAVHRTDPFDDGTSASFARVELAAIQEIGVFSDLDESKRAQVAEACRECEVEAGTKLTEEDDFGYAMIAFLEGTADVSRSGEYIRALGPGDVFGEIAVFFGGRRTATVTATSPMRLVMLFNSELARLDREVPELADELRKVIAERLERDAR
jgi:CRP/FNR family transcriptional regulator, cyclic AMP receptor protein